MPDHKGECSLVENIEILDGNNSEVISQSTYHLQSADKDSSHKSNAFNEILLTSLNAEIFKGP